ncbi:MAG TPA: GAF and ANTAR domain-containing protein [Glaciibacter sp.]|nr:GAF and ANTAR domain-containing protein [Glaciibacter sp.]
MAGVGRGQVVDTFVTLADTLVDGYDVVDLMHTLVDTCSALVKASAGGILLVNDHRQLEVVASTNERSRLVELMQLRGGGGPCLDSYLTGRPVSVPDLATDDSRWPVFRAQALEQHFRAVHAVPLRLRAETIGSLNLFWDRPDALDERDAEVVQALAHVATIGILQERAMRESTIAREQLQRALNSRVVIEQAKGVVAQTRNVGMEEAFSLIRDYARKNQTPLAVVSEGIVTRTITVP